MLAKHVTVLVMRDMAEKIPTTVFEHEVEVLRDVHGDGKIEIVNLLPDIAPVEIDTDEEMDRLRNTYGQSESGQSYAERVFGRSARGLEVHAFKPAKKGAAAPTKKGAADPELDAD
jgi:hypothetical protein